MNTNIDNNNSSLFMIKSLIKRPYSLSVYTPGMSYALKAVVTELKNDSGQLVLDIEEDGFGLEKTLSYGSLSFDLETLQRPDIQEREVFSLSNVTARLFRTDSKGYRLECELPHSIIHNEKRSEARIPFIAGMRTHVQVEVYKREHGLSARLCNLSLNGCMIEIGLAESIELNIGQTIPGITLEFPNGDTFSATCKVCHMRPLGKNGYAAVGMQFLNMSADQTEAIFNYVKESEREIIYRTGSKNAINTPSPLFINGANNTGKLYLRDTAIQAKLSRQIPMGAGVIDIANKLQIGLMHIKTHNIFPAEIFYDCVDTLRYMIDKDRKNFLYAMQLLGNVPDWIRHSLQVAGQLTDMLLIRNPYNPQIREIVLGAMLHNLGKPLLVSKQLPSLKINMNPAQKHILKGHVEKLRNQMVELNWEPSAICRHVIDNINERLDGTGYPVGKQAAQMTDLIKLASVIKATNTLLHRRNGIRAHTPIEAYRRLNTLHTAYDKKALVEYIQVYGLFPIGSLVKYSSGFLAWVMDIDSKGYPTQVNIVKNMRFSSNTISSIVSNGDLSQLGLPEKTVDPTDFDLHTSIS